MGRTLARCGACDHPQLGLADLHIPSDAAVTRHEAADVAKTVRRAGGHGRHLPDRRRCRRFHGRGPRSSSPQIAIVVATLCYAGAAIFGRGFKGLDPMAPAAGSLLCGRGDPDSAQPCCRAALDAGAVNEFAAGAARPCGVFDRVGVCDLFPADPDAGFGRHDGAGLSAGADRRRAGVLFLGEKPVSDGMDRPWLCRCGRGRDDDPGKQGWLR